MIGNAQTTDSAAAVNSGGASGQEADRRDSTNRRLTGLTHQKKRAAQVAEDIERYIALEGWPVGRVIFSEPELMRRYQVSRAIVREAVRLLEQHTTARMRKGPGGGLVVCRPEPEPVADLVAIYLEYQNVTALQLFEARAALELAAIELAAERITEDGIARLRKALDSELTMSAEELRQHGQGIHLAIAEIADSPAFPLFVDILSSLVDKLSISRRSEVNRAEVHHAHVKIVEALASGDTALASHRMRRHLEAVTNWLSP